MSSKKNVILGCLLLIVIGIPLAFFLGKRSTTRTTAVGIVNGHTIYEKDLTPQEQQSLFDASSQLYVSVENILAKRYFDDVIEKYKRKNNIKDDIEAQKKYIDEHTTVTNAQVMAFLEQNAENPQLKGKPLDEQKQLVEPYLKQEAMQIFFQGLIAKAVGDNDIKVLMAKKPKFQKVDLIINPDDPTKGPEDAPITIVEFADFQCPFCVKALPTVAAVLEQYKGKVRFVFKNYPLEQIHEEAVGAAISAECAKKQNKYWAMHDKLFENSNNLSPKLYTQLAKELSLDLEMFKACQNDLDVESKIMADIEYGRALGITATPAFYINGELLMGAQPLSAFERIINAELEKK